MCVESGPFRNAIVGEAWVILMWQWETFSKLSQSAPFNIKLILFNSKIWHYTMIRKFRILALILYYFGYNMVQTWIENSSSTCLFTN